VDKWGAMSELMRCGGKDRNPGDPTPDKFIGAIKVVNSSECGEVWISK
jgi:hypothetical protein